MKKMMIAVLVIAFVLCGCVVQQEGAVENTDETPVQAQAPVSTDVPEQTPEPTAAPHVPKGNRLYEQAESIALIAKLEGHREKLWTVEAHANNTFATGGEDGKIILWDATTLQPIVTDASHSRLVEEVWFLENGDVLSISDDHSVRRLSAEGASEKIYDGTTKEFTVSCDETLIAISEGNSVTIYDLDSFEERQTIKLTDGCFDIRFSSDNAYLFSVGHNGSVQKWNVETDALEYAYEGISWDVHCLEVSRDDKYIVAGATDCYVCVWDVETGELVSKYRHRDGLYDVAISADGKIVASVGVDRRLVVAETQTGQALCRLPHDDEIHAVAIDPNGQYIVAGGYDSVAYVWGFTTLDTDSLAVITADNAEDVEEVGQLCGHKGWVFDADISHDNTMVASGERGEVIKVNIWDVFTKTVLQSFELEEAPIELKFTHDDAFLLCKGEMGNLSIWDLSRQEIVYSSADNGEEVGSVAISSDDALMVTAGRGDIKLWDFKTMQAIREASFDDEYMISAAFSPDDSKIVFAYAGGTTDFSAHMLRTDDLSEIFATAGHEGYNYEMIFAQENNWLVSCGADNMITFWDADTGAHVRTLEGHYGKVMDVDFSLEEDVLVSGSAHDRTVRIWNVQTKEQLKKLSPGGEVQAVEMADNGRFFISAGENGTIDIWGVLNE